MNIHDSSSPSEQHMLIFSRWSELESFLGEIKVESWNFPSNFRRETNFDDELKGERADNNTRAELIRF